MATRVYTVTIETPEAEDDFNYTVQIVRNGDVILGHVATARPTAAWIGQAIMENVAEEE